ncbi:MAG: 5-oxoprolinase subunit PxpB [Faecalibacterium sp.]
MQSVSIKAVGASGLLVCFGAAVEESINAKVMALAATLAARPILGMGETVPSFASLLVYYNPLLTDYPTMKAAVEHAIAAMGEVAAATGKTVEIPVCYGGKYGEDLAFIAQHAGLSEAEVIALHSAQPYRIYMLGFLPGFPYLGGLDERLHTPRLANPRTKIPAGSVGIGGQQTGIYPMASPGGWQLLGRTPLRLFAPEKGGKLPYLAGDSIRFVPID